MSGTLLAEPRRTAARTIAAPRQVAARRPGRYTVGLVLTTGLLLALVPVAAYLQRAAVHARLVAGEAPTSNAYLCTELVGWLAIAVGYVAFRRRCLGTFEAAAEPRPWLQSALLAPTVVVHVYVAARWASLAVDRPTQLVAATVIPPAAVWVATLLVRGADEARRAIRRTHPRA